MSSIIYNGPAEKINMMLSPLLNAWDFHNEWLMFCSDMYFTPPLMAIITSAITAQSMGRIDYRHVMDINSILCTSTGLNWGLISQRGQVT